MIPLYIMLILNMVVSHQFILDHRMILGGMPINILEGSILLTFVYTILMPMRTAPIDQTRRNYLWPILTLWIIAAGAGTFLGFLAGSGSYMLVQTLKWYLKMPLGVMCGYMAVKNVRNARRVVKIICVLSCLVCVMILLHMREKSAEYVVTEAEGIVRTMNYNFVASAIVAVFMVYTAAVNPRFFSRTGAKVILAMSIVAAAGTLTRSIIISLVAAMIAIIILIPKVFRGRAWQVLFTSGVWIVAIVLIAGVLLQLVFGIDMIGATVARFKGEEGAEGSASGRWVGAINELKVWLGTTIIFGQGFGAVRQGWQEQAIAGTSGHNAYTSVLSRMGLVGLAAMVYPLWVALHIGRQMVRQINPDLRAAGALIMAGAALLFFQSFLSAGLGGERTALFFGMTLGIGIKCYRFEIADDYTEQIDRQLAWDGDA